MSPGSSRHRVSSKHHPERAFEGPPERPEPGGHDPADIPMTPRSKAVITMSRFSHEGAEAGYGSKSRQACLPGAEGAGGWGASVEWPWSFLWEDEEARGTDGGGGCTAA